jgi:hypothetical protein
MEQVSENWVEMSAETGFIGCDESVENRGRRSDCGVGKLVVACSYVPTCSVLMAAKSPTVLGLLVCVHRVATPGLMNVLIEAICSAVFVCASQRANRVLTSTPVRTNRLRRRRFLRRSSPDPHASSMYSESSTSSIDDRVSRVLRARSPAKLVAVSQRADEVLTSTPVRTI